MSNLKPEPNSSLGEPYAKKYFNPITKLCDTLRFLPIGKAGLNHKDPRDWDAYPKLDANTRKEMAKFFTPTSYLRMHYDKFIFEDFIGNGLHYPWDKFTYLYLKPDDSIHEYCKTRNKTHCKIIHLASQITIRNYLNQMSVNILHGDYGRIDNLIGPRLTFKNEKISDMEFLCGFKPYFHCPFEDKNEEKFSLYMIYTGHDTFEVIQCKATQHVTILQRIDMLTPLKLFDSMCAWCGKTRGDGKKNKLLKCKCKSCRYCSKRCQLIHWPAHKAVCPESKGGSSITPRTVQVDAYSVEELAEFDVDYAYPSLLAEIYDMANAVAVLELDMLETLASFEASCFDAVT